MSPMVHVAHTISGDELHAGAGGLLQLGFQVGHVRMLVSAMRGSQALGMVLCRAQSFANS